MQVSTRFMLITTILNPGAPTTVNVISVMTISVRIWNSEVMTALLNFNSNAPLSCLPRSCAVSIVRIVTPVSGSSLAAC
eukprot:3055972-Heterocapsa_arctica.AAC.1